MAWWTTQLIFREDTLISEGVDPVDLNSYRLVENGEEPGLETEHYTRVIVSGYALYGELRGYYALGVSHWHLDRAADRVYMSEASRRHTEPVASLTRTQRTIVRDFLVNMSENAWEASNRSFRQKLKI